MTSTAAINTANLKASVSCRLADKPAIVAACKNCAFYQCDRDDRCGPRGMRLETTNSRCSAHKFPVGRTYVCDQHQFKHADRRDV